MAIDPAAVAMPAVAFTPTDEDRKNFDKYFYFHRAGTTFPEALADLAECDGLASHLKSKLPVIDMAAVPYPYQYTLTGAVAVSIVAVLGGVITAPKQKHIIRRMNLRRCMNFKGYQRFGLSKELWSAFNYEDEGAVSDAQRAAMLAQQAKLASGPGLAAADLGL